jgi:hypothetical protein
MRKGPGRANSASIPHHEPVRTLRTNSDLYRAVVALGRSEPARERSLEAYLRALWSAGYDHCDEENLTVDQFVGLLASALDAPVPPFDPVWAREDLTLTDGADAFTVWARTLRTQICDLRELTAAGLYDNPGRYLGVDAPRPAGAGPRSTSPRWYNFDIAAYLESGAEGAFGGWRPEFDDAIVDGQPDDPSPLDAIEWTKVSEFTVCGQLYE